MGIKVIEGSGVSLSTDSSPKQTTTQTVGGAQAASDPVASIRASSIAAANAVATVANDAVINAVRSTKGSPTEKIRDFDKAKQLGEKTADSIRGEGKAEAKGAYSSLDSRSAQGVVGS
jgi:hypothetical protein